MYTYCNNNPVMFYDPTGAWSLTWGDFLDGLTNVAAAGFGVIVGGYTALETFVEDGATLEEALGAGIEAGVDAFGDFNNAVNSVYYYFSDGTPSFQESEGNEGNSHYVDNGYINRWERLDYAKQQTNEKHYNDVAQNYYAEYSAHMYAWFAIGWAEDKDLGKLSLWAKQSRKADVVVGVKDDREEQGRFIRFIGELGI